MAKGMRDALLNIERQPSVQEATAERMNQEYYATPEGKKIKAFQDAQIRNYLRLWANEQEKMKGDFGDK